MENITPDQARELGLKNYYTGIPCVNGHVSLRNVANNSCNECKRVRERKRDRRPIPKGESPEARERRLQRKRERYHVDAANKPAQTLPVLTRIAFDVVLMRPGTARVQSQMGCDKNAAQYFPKRALIDEVTEHMRIYPLDAATHRRIIKRVVSLYPAPRLTPEERKALIARHDPKRRGRPPRLSPRAVAVEKGEPHYMSEQPCARGHHGLRLTSTGYCLECQKQRVADRYESRKRPPAEHLQYAC